MEKLLKLRKSSNHKWNINRIYNEKLNYNCIQQLPTLRIKTQDLRKWGNSGEWKWNAQTRALYLIFSLKIRIYSYLVENSEKTRLNFYFKSRFSVKPSKFQIYFTNNCRLKWQAWEVFLIILSQIFIHANWIVEKSFQAVPFEINLKKEKWLVISIYPPPSQKSKVFLNFLKKRI